jgi:hypothetical protein
MRLSALLRPIVWIPTVLVILAVAAVAFFLMLQPDRGLADRLPARAVVAYFRGMQAKDLTPWIAALPVLSSVPAGEDRLDIALVDTGNGILGWAATSTEQQGVRAMARSSPAVDTLILSPIPDADLLGSDRIFRALYPPEGGAWFRADRLGLRGTTPGETLLGLPSNDMCCALSSASGTYVLRWIAEGTASALPHAPTLYALDPAPGFALAAGSLWEGLLALQPVPQELAPQALDAEIQNLLGNGVSAEYDIAPLLDGPATLYRDGTDMLAEGRGASAPVLMRTFTRLHESISSFPRSPDTLQRAYEGEVISKSIVGAAGDVRTSQERIQGWEVTSTDNGGGTGLFTARKGTAYIVSTRKDWLLQRLTGEARALTGGRALWSGRMPKEHAAGFLSPLFVPENALWWSLEQEGTVRTLRLRG